MNTANAFYRSNMASLIIIVWLIGLVAVFPQRYLFDIEVINVEDGLPHRRVENITQDKAGFIWLSTPGAVSRYDGYIFKTYTHDILNIRESDMSFLAADDQNRIWYRSISLRSIYGKGGGVISTQQDSIFSMEVISEGRFTAEDIVAMHNFKDNHNAICIATREGTVYTYEKGIFEEIYRFPKPVSAPLQCEIAPDGGYWIIHDREAINIKNKKRVETIRIDGSFLYIKRIVSTTPDLILSLRDASLTKYRKLEGHNFVPYITLKNAPDTLKRLIRRYEDYTIYTSGDALLIRDHQGKMLYRFDDFEPSGFGTILKNNKTFRDQQDILWMGTENGLFKINARKNPFEILQPGNSIRGIYREGNKLWAGGYYGNFISRLDNKTTIKYTPDPYTIISFYKDFNNNIWMAGSGRKLLEYNPKTDQYITYTFDYNSDLRLLFRNAVTKNYWLGTDKGLFRFHKKDTTVTPFRLSIVSEGLEIRQFYPNKEGFWIITNKGLFLMDAQKETLIKHYTAKDGLPALNITHLHEDAAGVFWLGTKGGGLLRWDRSSDVITQYTRNNGLHDNTVYAVYEDDYQTLWLPSNNGIMTFDKTTQSTKVYLPQNGIAQKEFNTFSHFKDKDGTLYFGGLKGITKFHPKTFREKSGVSPPLYATRVQVLEEDAEEYTDKTHAFKTTQRIILHPNDRILELELTLLDYEKSSENQYAYKLSGKQEQWIYTRQNKLSIINPPYGKYNLEIKARGASGSWSESPLMIPMHVQRPFYMQWWFILGAIIVVITAIAIGFRWRLQKLKKDRERLEAEVKKRTYTIEKQAGELKALDKAKSRFFANITHEFRTPLTLVRGPVEQMIAQPPPPAALKKRLSGVLKNTENLMGLINQLLDMSKLEGGNMRVEVSHGNIVDYTAQRVAQFQPLADEKKVQLNFTAHPNSWKTHFDSDKWTKILYNLLSNALKFTPTGGRVAVALEQVHQNHIQLIVKDTGIGIEAGQQEHIFDRFYQADASATRTAGGTGIGLALVKELAELQNGSVSVSSVVGEGTTFTLRLPVLPAPEEPHGVPVPEVPEIVFPFTGEAVISVKNEEDAFKNEDAAEKLELLIIEDNAEMRAYIRSCIDTSIYTITETANGLAGIEKAQQMVPDLIISDIMMPKKNGFEVVHAIRSHIATSHIPLILLTAKASLESRLEGLERGADAYLTKPFSPQELALRIRKLIELRKLLRQRYQNTQDLPEESTAFQKEDRFISELKDYILDNIGEPGLDVESISRHFAISRAQFYRKLKALMNKPIADYIRSIRLEKAAQLLKEQQFNVTEVAYATGFSSLSHFSKTFKKAYGKAPSEL